jgi:hypothetical protein
MNYGSSSLPNCSSSAEATQYYETLALEREMQADVAKERAWLESQRTFEVRKLLTTKDENDDENGKYGIGTRGEPKKTRR